MSIDSGAVRGNVVTMEKQDNGLWHFWFMLSSSGIRKNLNKHIENPNQTKTVEVAERIDDVLAINSSLSNPFINTAIMEITRCVKLLEAYDNTGNETYLKEIEHKLSELKEA